MSNSQCEYFSTVENICFFFVVVVSYTKTMLIVDFNDYSFIAAELSSECRLYYGFVHMGLSLIYSKGRLSSFLMC